MRERISGTARYGGVTRGPRVIDDRVRETMRQILAEIRDGRFAKEWGAEAAGGYKRLRELVEKDRTNSLEQVGARLRNRRDKD